MSVIREALPSDAAAIARVHVASWRTTYRGIMPDAFLQSLSCHEREARWRETLGDRQPDAAPDSGATCTLVAETAEVIVGFVSAGPQREGIEGFDGEIYAIYLLAEHQGRGIGRRLTGEAARRLLDAGYRSALVWVLAANPSRGFYEALGGRELRRKEIEIAGRRYEEIAYGWRDLGFLLAR